MIDKRFLITSILIILTSGFVPVIYGDDVFTQTEHGGTNINSDAYVLAGSCGTCHTQHNSQDGAPVSGSGPFKYLLNGANNNSFCTNCHLDSSIGSPPGRPPFEKLWAGETKYNASAHGTSLFKTDPDTGFDLPLCLACHDPHGRGTGTPYPALRANNEENLCYACHDSNGPAQNDIKSKMQGTATSTSPVSESSAKINTRHDISLSDQNWSGAKIECKDCHNPHLNNSSYNGVDKSKVRDPAVDPSTAVGAANFIDTYNVNDPDRPGDLDPNILPESPASPVPDYIDFCLVCHDGSYPSWINPGTNPPAVINWESTSGNYHGGKYGGGNSGQGYLKSRTPGNGYVAGYTGADYQNLGSYTAADSYAPMLCTDCHDPHGVNNNLFMIKKTINGKSGITWTNGGRIYYKMCTACHKMTGKKHTMKYGESSTCSRQFHSHTGSDF